jgi:aminoglycoside phosphotransferase family enzyme
MDDAGKTGGAPAEVVETHVSVLFFVGDRVYKLRKPVRFGFVDFTDRRSRLEDCRREVALNRRLSPDVYLGVADLSIAGQPLDHLVVMRRLPPDRRLSRLLDDPELLSRWIPAVARVLADFHAGAARSTAMSARGTAQALRSAWEANFAEVDRFVGPVLDPGAEAELRRLVVDWLGGRDALLRSRIDAGRICDGHGDLQASDIFCLDDGVRVLDCLQFSDDLRFTDVIADVGFLAMDLERLGRPAAAAALFDSYQELAGDRFPPPLVHHYVAARAYIRAEVACLRWSQGSTAAGDEARALHALSLGHLRRARVVLALVGGLPGSGKSTLAAGIGESCRWTVLRSDEIRREIVGSDGTENDRHRPAGGAYREGAYGEGAYRPAVTTATYTEMLQRAGALLARGESVVLDATFADPR